MNSRNVAGDLVYTLSARTVLNFRGSYSMLEDDYSAPKSAIGVEGLAQFWPNNPWYQPYTEGMPLVYYPNITINGQTASSYGKGSYWYQHPHHYAFSGKMSQTRGSHYMKFGAEYRYHVGIGMFPNLMNFNFYPDSTANTYLSPDTSLSGDPHASFLLGVVDNRSAARGYPFQTMRVPFFGAFVHDDWKISRRLTVNLGLRYEWESGPYDDNDIYSRYLDLNAPNRAIQNASPAIPADLVALSTPKYNGAWVFTDSKNRKAFVTQRLILLPRIGMALRVNDKTAVNVGFARYVVPVVVGQGTHERQYAGRLPVVPGVQPDVDSITLRGGPPEGISVKSVSRRQSSPAADRQDPRSVQQRRKPRQLGGPELSGANQRSRELYRHAGDSGPVQAGCDVVHEHRAARSAQSAIELVRPHARLHLQGAVVAKHCESVL